MPRAIALNRGNRRIRKHVGDAACENMSTAYSESDLRYFAGVTPYFFLNAFMKYDTLSNPIAWQHSSMEQEEV